MFNVSYQKSNTMFLPLAHKITERIFKGFRNYCRSNGWCWCRMMISSNDSTLMNRILIMMLARVGLWKFHPAMMVQLLTTLPAHGTNKVCLFIFHLAENYLRRRIEKKKKGKSSTRGPAYDGE